MDQTKLNCKKVGRILPHNRFFNGSEIENISKELALSCRDVEVQLFESIDYLELTFRIAEILEVPNIKALDKMISLLFNNEPENAKKESIIQCLSSKKPITYMNFQSLNRSKFPNIIDKIEGLTADLLRIRRIEHALLDTIFYDLNTDENMLCSRLEVLINDSDNRYKSKLEVADVLEKHGFSLAYRDLVKTFCDERALTSLNFYRNRSINTPDGKLYWNTSDSIKKYRQCDLPKGLNIISSTPDPDLNGFYYFEKEEKAVLEHYFESVRNTELKKGNCFEGTAEIYYASFLEKTMPKVEAYLTKRFGNNWENLTDIILTGIGGNEMLAHLIQAYANLHNNKVRIHLLTFPSKWGEEIKDQVGLFLRKHNALNLDNLVVIAMSRSGKTYETVKTCEYVAKLFGGINLIGVANGGRINEIAHQHKGITINFPLGIAGRLSTFNTPVFPLPMKIIDSGSKVKITDHFMEAIQRYDRLLSLSNPDSLAWAFAQKIYSAAYVNGMNLKIYQGSNSKMTMNCFRHMEQVIMEGIKHNISCMLPKSMPDAAHFNMEQTLKFGELFYHFWIIETKPLHGREADLKVKGLNVNEQMAVLLKGQFEKIKMRSPLDILVADDIYDVDVQAFIFKLVENTTYFLARLLGDDPEGNPDVKDVRDLSAKAEQAVIQRKQNDQFDIVDFYKELER